MKNNLLSVADACILKKCSEYAIRAAIHKEELDTVVNEKKSYIDNRCGPRIFVVNNKRLANLKIRAHDEKKRNSGMRKQHNGVWYRDDLMGKDTSHPQ